MELFKNYKSKITPTCMKETIEKKERVELSEKMENRERMIREDREEVKKSVEQPLFKTSEPYPELVDIIPNRTDVRQLKMLTSGRNGELTNALTYMYQQFILEEEYPEIAKDLGQIAAVEMEHYSILSRAIVSFGGDPNLTNGMGDVWTGRNLSTEKDAKRILQDDIKMEERSITDYTAAAKETKNLSLAKLYVRIAKDEVLHIASLKRLLESLS